MFGFIAKMPKLAIIGAIVLLIGFSPEILATVNIDTVPPRIEYTYPDGTDPSEPDGAPTPLTLGETITLTLLSDSVDVHSGKVTCKVWPCALPSDQYTTEYLIAFRPEVYESSYTIEHEGKYQFYWEIYDGDNNKSEKLTWGEVGDADGDFYMKDGNDPDYRLVTKDATIRFNHRTIYFKFKATEHAPDITDVWIEVYGETRLDLTNITYDEWDGASWTALSDGSYTIYGYFSAFGRDFRNLSILVGSGEEPTPPSEWSTYDWLKILGGALIVVGFITKK